MGYLKFIDGLNPLKDMEWFDFSHLGKPVDPEAKEGFKEGLKMSLDAYVHMFMKPFIRGAAIGGSIGALVYYLSGDDAKEGFKNWLTSGSIIDFSQLQIRSWYELYKYYKNTK